MSAREPALAMIRRVWKEEDVSQKEDTLEKPLIDQFRPVSPPYVMKLLYAAHLRNIKDYAQVESVLAPLLTLKDFDRGYNVPELGQ